MLWESLRIGVMMGACAALVATAEAHHTYVKDYDNKRIVRVTGKVGNVRYSNPHVFFDVIADGKAWTVETESIPVAAKSGLTKEKLIDGANVTVMGWQARDGSAALGLQSISFGNGPAITVRRTAR